MPRRMTDGRCLAEGASRRGNRAGDGDAIKLDGNDPHAPLARAGDFARGTFRDAPDYGFARTSSSSSSAGEVAHSG